MKIRFILWLLSLPLFVGFIQAADDPRNIAGYGKTVWGMSEDEVLEAESPRAEKLDEPERTRAGIRSIIIREVEIASAKFRVWFFFDDKSRKLIQVAVASFEEKNPGLTFSSIEKFLTEKYGAPTYKQEKGASSDTRNMSWKLPNTVIELWYFRILPPYIHVIYKPAAASADASKNL